MLPVPALLTTLPAASRLSTAPLPARRRGWPAVSSPGPGSGRCAACSRVRPVPAGVTTGAPRLLPRPLGPRRAGDMRRELVIALLVPEGEPVKVLIDDTLFRRRGKRVWAASWLTTISTGT